MLGSKERPLDDSVIKASTAVPIVPQKNPSPYRVLEAPPLISPTNQRSPASDILEKARDRFDRFWGKDKCEGESSRIDSSKD